jgi:hypothetical protein
MSYIIMNDTDGIPFSFDTFRTKKEGQEAIDKFKAQLKEHQGYYLTSGHERIPVDEVQFRFIELTKNNDFSFHNH